MPVLCIFDRSTELTVAQALDMLNKSILGIDIVTRLRSDIPDIECKFLIYKCSKGNLFKL